jgi:hypothetical protein
MVLKRRCNKASSTKIIKKKEVIIMKRIMTILLVIAVIIITATTSFANDGGGYGILYNNDPKELSLGKDRPMVLLIITGNPGKNEVSEIVIEIIDLPIEMIKGMTVSVGGNSFNRGMVQEKEISFRGKAILRGFEIPDVGVFAKFSKVTQKSIKFRIKRIKTSFDKPQSIEGDSVIEMTFPEFNEIKSKVIEETKPQKLENASASLDNKVEEMQTEEKRKEHQLQSYITIGVIIVLIILGIIRIISAKKTTIKETVDERESHAH